LIVAYQVLAYNMDDSPSGVARSCDLFKFWCPKCIAGTAEASRRNLYTGYINS